jgi:hypothetical protein
MAENGDTGGSDEPEHGGEGRCPQTEGNCDDKQPRVELRGAGAHAAKLQVVALELADAEHAANDEADNEEQQQIGQETVYAEHGEHSCVVAREVAQVVVDPALDLAKVGGLGDALDVEELGDGPQVGEARGYRCVAQAVEAPGEVHTRRQSVDGNAEAGHDGKVCWRRESRAMRVQKCGGTERD